MIQLSIIIPYYNSGSTIKRLIDSIPQSDDYEIIIVDDHSDEGQFEQLNQLKRIYPKKRIYIYQNESNKKGAGAARNLGIKNARGKWCLFADADDFFQKGFLEKVQNYFNSNYDIVFFKPTSMCEDTHQMSNRHQKYEDLVNDFIRDKNSHTELNLRSSYYVPWSKLYRLGFIEEYKIEFDEVPASNDVMFSVKTGFFAKSITASDEVIYCVTRNKGSLTTNINEEIFDTRLEVSISRYKFLEKNLSVGDFKSLGLSGQGYLVMARKYGVKKIYQVIRILRMNQVRLFSSEILNPITLFKRYIKLKSREKQIKKYQ
ncbi:glycosyltransferase [Texcoconibacillus texcoconensis]|uniref:Glycosyltransferase involved in cell wall biosynthesis n=1 Tax=Texcoconibacillus texcoconensis TaxID=1095777 RepID=A0A840QTF9_9BACI|nr:glycosyltransferase involved in cell wall biosynthesis [Texcoconibacillus texcoconensis]